MGMAAKYPTRESYYAHRYCRLLTKTCAAQEIGHTAFVLCVTIVHQEDAKRYRGAVTFYNEQLMPLVGVAKWDSLDAARKRAAESGWLHYEPGNRGKRQPGRYWVTIPEGLGDLTDAPVDETHSPVGGESGATQSPTQSPANGERAGERAGARAGDRAGDRAGELSTLSPNPPPKPKKRAPTARPEDIDLPAALDSGEFRAAWAEWIGYRRERRLTVTERTLTKQLGMLAELGEAAAIESIQTSIRAGWQGVFPPKHGAIGHARQRYTDGPGQVHPDTPRRF